MGELEPSHQSPVLSTRIIILALVVGLIMATALMIGLRLGRTSQQGTDGLLTKLCLGIGIVTGVLSRILPPRLHLSRPDDSLTVLANKWQTQTIISAALCEGSGFLNAIAYFVDGRTISLAVIGVLAAMILAKFPTETKWRNFVENHASQYRN
ncbi:hypothetical protein [Planctomicrobium sp. SH664]|uniref:hypothetical protein n=1 Tax=Planctomicrobium sp. SH664 TaxID=3448125 RepID=UPI003F5BA584